MTRLELERLCRLYGYEPDRDDTDADLEVVLEMRVYHRKENR
jgi:hypothetical protein